MEHCWHDIPGTVTNQMVFRLDGFIPSQGKAICCHCGKESKWHTEAVRDESHGKFFPRSRTVTVYDDASECQPPKE